MADILFFRVLRDHPLFLFPCPGVCASVASTGAHPPCCPRAQWLFEPTSPPHRGAVYRPPPASSPPSIHFSPCDCRWMPGDVSLGSLCGAAPVSLSPRATFPLSLPAPLVTVPSPSAVLSARLLAPVSSLSSALPPPPVPVVHSFGRSQYHFRWCGCWACWACSERRPARLVRSARSLTTYTHSGWTLLHRPTTYSARERRQTRQSENNRMDA